MATDPFLLRALLAMDAYNQGYSPGVKSVGGQIGEATQLSVALPNGSQNVGFYALAYSLPDGSKIIVYRGTTFEQGLNTLNDIIYGWTPGVGYSAASQPQFAKDFYLAVTGRNVYETSQPTNVVLTGHSLGGGLASENKRGRGGSFWKHVFDMTPPRLHCLGRLAAAANDNIRPARLRHDAPATTARAA